MARCSNNCSPKSKGGGCCTWPHAMSFFIVCILVGILTWQVPDWDIIVGSFLPDFDHEKEPGEPTTFPSAAPSVPPTLKPVPFSECSNSDFTSITCCNGLASNCDLRLNEVMYATSHNAMSSVEDKFSGPNHFQSLEKSMEVGYRAFLLDLCDCGVDGIQLCHALCALGKRDPALALYNMKTFLDDNPNEVIIIVFQIGRDVTGTSPIPLDYLYEIMKIVPGFVDMMYNHNAAANQKQWPTLQNLIDNNQRIVVFHHEGSDCTNNNCPNGLHYYFTYVVNTRFSFKSKQDLEYHDQSCLLALGAGGTRDFYTVNNFVTKVLPSAEAAKQVNQAQFLEEHIDRCQEITSLAVNFVTVDFWSIGHLPSIVQSYNKERASSIQVQ